jgi:heterodisulfide reductase subunit A
MAAENKQNQQNSETRVGVYICHCGGNISDHVDVEKVREEAERTPGVEVARTNMFMCSDPGQEQIMEDLRTGRVDRVVVASCAPALHEETFRSAMSRAGANPYVYEHANIREQVSWVHHGDPATHKASKLVSAAAAKAARLKPLEPIRVEARPHATVIGGGIAGLRAAKDLADRGIQVTLIEKTPFLGGNLAQLDRISPEGESAAELLTETGSAVLEHPFITVYTCSEMTGFEGYVGNFNLRITRRPPTAEEDLRKVRLFREAGRKAGEFVHFAGIYLGDVPESTEELAVETGSVVMATGFRPYQPRTGEYGFGEHSEVITLPELIRQMAENPPAGGKLVVNGREIRSVGMIHCVGSRQIPGVDEPDEDGNLNEYCSRTCCSATLHAANTIRETWPSTRVFDFYRDIRTYGRGQEELYSRASGNRVLFFRFEAEEPPRVLKPAHGDTPLSIKVKDVLTFGEELEVPVDLVVLAVGMEPGDISGPVEMMKLPVGEDRFLQEVHPKLRPVELSVSGIMLAGTCQAPMDVGEACTAASGASAKAAALLAKGYVELDPFVAEVNPERCAGHGACVDACLREGALTLKEVEKGGKTVRRAEVNPALCLGCGACVAACPENAININGWTLDQFEAMVDAIAADEPAA